MDVREVLEEERRATLRRLATLTGDFDALVEASEGSNADDEHDPEGRRSPSSVPSSTPS